MVEAETERIRNIAVTGEQIERARLDALEPLDIDGPLRGCGLVRHTDDEIPRIVQAPECGSRSGDEHNLLRVEGRLWLA
jgi:hypothetical protein